MSQPRITLALSLLVLAACPDLGDAARAVAADAAGPSMDGDHAPVEHMVFMQALAFCDQVDCGDVSRIQPGDTVTWVNNDTAFHEIAYGNPDTPGTELFHSPPIQVGQSWSYTFDASGDYEYYCANHRRIMNMAHIIVGGSP